MLFSKAAFDVKRSLTLGVFNVARELTLYKMFRAESKVIFQPLMLESVKSSIANLTMLRIEN